MTEGVDYSYDRPDPAALVAAGKHFACRYLSDNPSKNLTRAEADAGAAAGLWWIVVWEAHGADISDAPGYATESVKQAKALGIPAGRPIYFAIDFDAQPNEFDEIEQALREFGAGLSPYVAGMYGGENVVREMLNRGAVKWAWQTYAWSNARDARAQLYQYSNNITLVGANVDLDTAYADDYGQWRPGILPDGAGGDELTAADKEWLTNLVDNQVREELNTFFRTNKLIVTNDRASTPNNVPYSFETGMERIIRLTSGTFVGESGTPHND